MKNTFKSLSIPWSEEPADLDNMVWTAIGLYNKKHV
jgi:hypothetical protein